MRDQLVVTNLLVLFVTVLQIFVCGHTMKFGSTC